MTEADFQRWRPLLVYLSRRYAQATKTRYDDAFADALEGLCRGLRTYEPRRGKLSAWLSVRINGAMRDNRRIRDQTRRSRSIRLRECKRLDRSVRRNSKDTYADYLPDARGTYDMEAIDTADEVARLLLCLQPRQRDIMRAWAAGERQWEIAERHGLSSSAVSIIIKKSLAVIRESTPAQEAREAAV